MVCSWPGQEASALALLSPCGGIILLLSVLVRYRLATRQGMLCKIGLYLHANGIDLVAGTMAGRLGGAEKGLMHSRKIIRVKGINHSSHAETHRQQGVSRSLECSCARQGKLWNDETDGGQQSAATALRHALWHLSTGCSLTRPIGCRRFGHDILRPQSVSSRRKCR